MKDILSLLFLLIRALVLFLSSVQLFIMTGPGTTGEKEVDGPAAASLWLIKIGLLSTRGLMTAISVGDDVDGMLNEPLSIKLAAKKKDKNKNATLFVRSGLE